MTLFAPAFFVVLGVACALFLAGLLAFLLYFIGRVVVLATDETLSRDPDAQ